MAIRNEFQIDLVSDPFDNRTYYDSRGHTLVDEGVREPVLSDPYIPQRPPIFEPPPEPTDITPSLPPEELIAPLESEPIAPPEIAIVEPISEVTITETQPVISGETNTETVQLEPPPGTTGVGTGGGSSTPTEEPITRLTDALASLFPATNVSGGIRPSAYAPLGISQESAAPTATNNRGVVLLIILAVVAGGYYFWKKRKKS